MRLSRDLYFMELAKTVANQSTCSRAKVGAVLVDGDNYRIISTGFNGSVPGAKHCEDGGCVMEDGHCRTTVHAEMNALLFKVGKYDNLVLYSTTMPCYQCYKALYTAGVNAIYYLNDYDDRVREEIIKNIPEDSRIRLIKIGGSFE